MSQLEDVKGLGEKTVQVLKEAGIDSVEKLANSNVEDLSELKGIGKKSGQKYIDSAMDLIGKKKEEKKEEEKVIEAAAEKEQEEEISEEVKEQMRKAEEKRKKLEGKDVEEGDFILVKITGKTQKGTIFKVSSEEDAKKAGIYDENEARQGVYSPEFIVVGKPGFVNEGLMETIENMKYFEKKTVRIPPGKAFGKRDPSKIERIGITKFRRMNEGKPPEVGQEFTRKTQQGQQRGRVVRVAQGKVMVDYNHPLAGQNVDYIVEITDKIEDFDEKVKYFMINKGIPEEQIPDFEINYLTEDNTLEITIPKMFLFQNLTYFKFGLAMDLQTHLADQVDDVKFIEVYEKMPSPQAKAQAQATTDESIKKKIEEFNEEEGEDMPDLEPESSTE
jgi:FKBP-type peptidyl-prolyl cis-trans isomerase SlyD